MVGGGPPRRNCRGSPYESSLLCLSGGVACTPRSDPVDRVERGLVGRDP